jgi:hypothetical protein
VNGKPKIVENLTVDFGNSWLGDPMWIKPFDFIGKMVRGHLEQTEMSLKALSNQVSQYLQRVREETEEELGFLTSRKGSKIASNALKDIQASTKALMKQANNEMKQLSKHIHRELKVQKRTAKKMLQRSNELAKRGFETMDLVRRDVAETCAENLKAFADMVQNVDITSPLRSRVVKKAAGNAKKLVAKVKSKAEKDDEKPKKKAKEHKRAAKKQDAASTRNHPHARPRDDVRRRF